jgi:hypothetical protein
MKNVWRTIYGMLFALSLLGGAGVFGKPDLSRANTDWYAVAACLFVSAMFPSMALWQAHSKKLTPVPLPAFDRGISGWWFRAPLQCARICSVLFFGSFIGSLLVLRDFSSGQPFMMACVAGSFAFGFAAGELICKRWLSRFISAHGEA